MGPAYALTKYNERVANVTKRNYRNGIKECSVCADKRLIRSDFDTARLTQWRCWRCDNLHYWSWDNNEDYHEEVTKEER